MTRNSSIKAKTPSIQNGVTTPSPSLPTAKKSLESTDEKPPKWIEKKAHSSERNRPKSPELRSTKSLMCFGRNQESELKFDDQPLTNWILIRL
jgi:hypothetical protein